MKKTLENRKLNIAFYITHPGHVYLWISLARKIKQHNVFIIAKQKDNLIKILDSFNIQYETIGEHYPTIIKKINGFIRQVLLLKKYIKNNKIHLSIGMYSCDLSVASRFANSKCIIFYSDNKHHWKGDKLEEIICNASANFIVCPAGSEKLNKKAKFAFDGVCNLAYLHPHYFAPDIKILKKYGLKQPYVIIKDKLGSSLHDFFIKNLIDIDYLSNNIPCKYSIIQISTVGKFNSSRFITLSGNSDIHHILYYSDLFIGDSALMAHEAAVLGVPTLVISEMVHGRHKHLEEHKILQTFSDTKSAQKRIDQILSDEEEKKKWKIKAENYVESIGDIQPDLLNGIKGIISDLPPK